MDENDRKRPRRGRQKRRPGRASHEASVPSTEAQNNFGEVLSRVSRGQRVIITKHKQPTAVLLSVREYAKLVGSRSSVLDTLTEEFDALLKRMQTPEFDQATRALFDADSDELGADALRAVKAEQGGEE